MLRSGSLVYSHPHLRRVTMVLARRSLPLSARTSMLSSARAPSCRLLPQFKLDNLMRPARRYASTAAEDQAYSSPETKKSFWSRHPFIKWTLLGSGSVVFGLSATTLILLGYDAMTYKHNNIDNVPVSTLALHPQPGGPKNLPILSHFIGKADQNSGANTEAQEQNKPKKERLLIVGGGWAGKRKAY